MKYRKINYDILPKYAIEFLNYRLYSENLSQFTVYADAQRLISFLKYVMCTKCKEYKKDITEYFNITDMSSLPLRCLKHFKLTDMLHYIEFLTEEKNLCDQAKANYVATARTFYYYLCKKLHYFRKLYFEDLAIPKFSRKHPNYLSVNECKTLLSSVDKIENPRNKAIVYLALQTGARRCEITNALLSNLDLEKGILRTVGKGNKDRFLYLNSSVIKVLQDYLKIRKSKSPYLFVTFHGLQIDYNDVYRIVQNSLKNCNLDITKYSTHNLRHSFATLLYLEGVDIKVIQQLLGHEHIETTLWYTHLKSEALLETVENFVLNIS